MKDDEFLIHVNISGTKIPLKIPRKEEEIYRNAEKLLAKRLDIFLNNYRQKSREEILTYLAYDFAVLLYKKEFLDEVSPLAEKIQELNDQLENILSEE